MQFSFTGEQEEFRSVLRRFLEEKSPTTVVRRLMETEAGWERDGWRELNQQLGLTAVHIPEAYGGQGFGYVELGIVLEEMGRALALRAVFRLDRAGRDGDHECRYRRAETHAAARHRIRGHHRHAGVHRAERTLGCGGVCHDRNARRRRSSGWTASRVSCSTAIPPT